MERSNGRQRRRFLRDEIIFDELKIDTRLESVSEKVIVQKKIKNVTNKMRRNNKHK